MSDVVLRPPRPGDVERAGAITRKRYEDLAITHERDVRDGLGTPGWRDKDDVMLAIVDGSPVGYAWLRDWVDLGYLEMWVLDGHRGAGVGSRLIDWALDAARARNLPQVRGIAGSDDGVARFAARHGFSSAGGSILMNLDPDVAMGEPGFPDGIAVRQVDDKDGLAEIVWRIDQAGFGDNPTFAPTPVENFERTIARDDFDVGLVWLAFSDDGEDAGLCIATHLPDQGLGVIEDLAVIPAFRRRGLGRALLRRGVGALRSRGVARVVLDTNQANTRAQALYNDEGFRESFRHDAWMRAL